MYVTCDTGCYYSKHIIVLTTIEHTYSILVLTNQFMC